jgi:gamma-glutamyltranspeptidase/glutathione hydrolase
MRAALNAIALAASLAGAGPASTADLSPRRWPAATRAELEAREYYLLPAYPAAVKARSVLVTATGSPIAVHAGVDALKQGGTAADAAATVALTQVSTRLGSVVSYAGILKLVYFEAKTGKVYSLDASWGTYAGETDPASIPPSDTSLVTGITAPKDAGTGPLGRQTLVPGFMAGIEAMHGRFGRLPFADLFQPAIWYAENGVSVSPALEGYFRYRQPNLWRTAAGRRFASMPDGALPKAGDLYRQPDLARTLRAVASRGAAYMYAGDWARAFVEAVNAEGGKATLADLAAYKPAWGEPLNVAFAGTTVYAPGGGSDGSCPTLVALNLLSGLPVDRMGPYWRDPKAFVSHLDAVRYAYAQDAPDSAPRERSKACGGRLSPDYGAAAAPQMRRLMSAPPADIPRGSHTEAVIVVDRWGNVAVLVHTINTIIWGDTGIVVGGIPIADAAAINKDQLTRLKPGESVPGTTSPVIALRNARPVLAVAGVGTLTPETVRLVVGMLAQGGDLRTLMAAPPLLVTGDTAAGPVWNWRETVPAGAYNAELREAIEALGVHLKEETPERVQVLRGTAVAAVIDQPSGAASAVEVPGVFGFAEADRPAITEMPREVRLPASALDDVVGDYDVGANFQIRVYRVGGRLFAKASGRPAVELFAASETLFFEKVENVQVVYQRDGQNRVSRAVIRRAGGPEVIAIRRLADPRPQTQGR